MPSAWLMQLAIYLGLLAGAFGAGWACHAYRVEREQLAEQLSASEGRRESERLAARNMTRISDALTTDRLRSDRAAADAAGRLRQLAEAASGPAPGCPGRNDDARPAAGLLRDEDRDDLVALAKEADAVADRLRACQAVAAGTLRSAAE